LNRLPARLQAATTQLSAICQSACEVAASVKRELDSETQYTPLYPDTLGENDSRAGDAGYDRTNDRLKRMKQDLQGRETEVDSNKRAETQSDDLTSTGLIITGNRTRTIQKRTLDKGGDGLFARLGEPAGPKLKELSGHDVLECRRQLESKEDAQTPGSAVAMNYSDLLESPSGSFKQALHLNGQKVSAEVAHALTCFVTAVASPEALVQFKEAIVGWRSLPVAMESMRADRVISVLKALRLLEAQSAFTSIATRIKLVQLSSAVDSASLSRPYRRRRGNPIVMWLSSQYKLFLRAEYPNLEEGSQAWKTKLDDLKKKVRAGRRWQQLINKFGLGIIGLVPFSFELQDGRPCDFDRRLYNSFGNCSVVESPDANF
jgi:hypothetical protein